MEKAEFMGTWDIIYKNNDYLKLGFPGLMRSFMTRLFTGARGERSFSLTQTRVFVSQNKLKGKLRWTRNGRRKISLSSQNIKKIHISVMLVTS